MATKLYRDAAFADGCSTALRVGVSVLVEGNRVVWIRPTDGEEEVGSEVELVDAYRCWLLCT
jgi:hypothetical protein